MRALAVHSPALTHAATVPLDSPLKSLADLKGARVLKRPAVVGTTTGSTNHFGFIAAAHYLGLKQNEDYTLRSTPPGDLATGPKGIDVYTIWEPHVSYSTDVLKVTRLLGAAGPVLHLQRLLLRPSRDRGERAGRDAVDDRCIHRGRAVGQGESRRGGHVAHEPARVRTAGARPDPAR